MLIQCHTVNVTASVMNRPLPCCDSAIGCRADRAKVDSCLGLRVQAILQSRESTVSLLQVHGSCVYYSDQMTSRSCIPSVHHRTAGDHWPVWPRPVEHTSEPYNSKQLDWILNIFH